MKKTKLIVKIALDIAMLLLFLSLVFGMKPLGIVFHEVAGVVILILFALHLILNRNFISAAVRGKLKNRRAMLNLLIDTALLIAIIVAAWTGIKISDVLFYSAHSGHQHGLVYIHKASSYTALGIIALHLLMHLKYLINSIKHIIKRK